MQNTIEEIYEILINKEYCITEHDAGKIEGDDSHTVLDISMLNTANAIFWDGYIWNLVFGLYSHTYKKFIACNHASLNDIINDDNIYLIISVESAEVNRNCTVKLSYIKNKIIDKRVEGNKCIFKLKTVGIDRKKEEDNSINIKVPEWCKIGKRVYWNSPRITGMEWVRERILGYGLDGFFHSGGNTPVYYTKFSEFGKTVMLEEPDKNLYRGMSYYEYI